MRRVPRASAQDVCLPCLLRIGKSNTANLIELARQPSLNQSRRLLHTSAQCRQHVSLDKESKESSKQHAQHQVASSNSIRSVPAKHHGGNVVRRVQSKAYATAANARDSIVELSEEQMRTLHAAHRLKKRLNNGASRTTGQRHSNLKDAPIEDVLKAVDAKDSPPDEARLLGTLQQVYAGRMFTEVIGELTKVVQHRNPPQKKVADVETKQILSKLGLLPTDSIQEAIDVNTDSTYEEIGQSISQSIQSSNTKSASTKSAPKLRQSLLQSVAKHTPAKQPATRQSRTEKSPAFPAKTKATWVAASDLELKPVEFKEQSVIPKLSHDLSRVLFNPGIYHLQDPRSRVYNFDPYLEQPMPVSEFNFDALNTYLTSSEDPSLLGLARSLDKRYIGSSSSMSGALSQFHFLLSNWRELSTDQLSKGFAENRKDFTVLTRSPAAIFLRYRDGVYAVDADKEYDTPNILMGLGHSLEKLLTLEKEEFEKWRKTHTAADALFTDTRSEAYHYSEQGSFLLRSQLDAYDPRLPGTGVFDLKTRAVAGIRMNIRSHEKGMGYQIKDRFGTWESFEREYYDMMRSTFLKYSMQVRMGKMDGIFVAYHNIERIFGFQYISLSDMDYALHGQRDPCLGDQEFRFSVNLMKEIFDKVTKLYPEQSIRFHFETREPSTSEPKPFMNIFAEPMTNEEIDEIQARNHEESIAFEKRVFHGQDPAAQENLQEAEESTGVVIQDQPSDLEVLSKDTVTVSEAAKGSGILDVRDEAPPMPSGTAANITFLDKMIGQIPTFVQPKGPRPVVGFKLSVQNVVNDFPVSQPADLSPGTEWSVGYTMEQMSDESARRQYIFCKNRRMSALSAGKMQSGTFIERIRELSSQGAEWRKAQDEQDAQRETVVLYQDRVSK